MGTELYERTIEWSKANLDDEGVALMLKCWDARPWMVSAYTGNSYDERNNDMLDWCRDNFGDEASPIHCKPGAWYRGSVTINGWATFGFETKEMMEAFIDAWPYSEQEAA